MTRDERRFLRDARGTDSTRTSAAKRQARTRRLARTTKTASQAGD